MSLLQLLDLGGVHLCESFDSCAPALAKPFHGIHDALHVFKQEGLFLYGLSAAIRLKIQHNLGAFTFCASITSPNAFIMLSGGIAAGSVAIVNE
jgi:hypothetical protein